MTEKQLSEIMYEVCDSLNVPLTHEESEMISQYAKAIKQHLEAGQNETIVICYVVFVKGGYNNEDIDSIWFDKEKAIKRKEEVRGYRIENHEIN